MIWSISSHKQFQRCRRQWFYKNKVADDRVKNNLFRKEVTLLSKLQTIQSWRGTIVDNIISRLLVNALNNKRPIVKEYFLKEALDAFEKQLEYAVFQKYREPGSTYSDPNFSALLAFEFGSTTFDEELNEAKQDIEIALFNLLEDVDFLDYLKSAKKLISQRTLTYTYNQFSVQAKPDLIVFFHDAAPHIFDWKVHTYGTYTYDEQLVSYAIALNKVAEIKPHIDFPTNLSSFSLYEYKLTEYQLLHKDRLRRNYTITDDRLEKFYSDLSSSVMEMYIAGTHKPYNEWGQENYAVTDFLENCRNCGFKKICN